MSTDILSISFRAEQHSKIANKKCYAEIKSGFLVLLGTSLRQHVRVVVYRTSLEHFAVIYPRKRLSKAVGVVNLRNTMTDRVEMGIGFLVRHKGYDNTVLARFLCSERELEAWLSAFESKIPSPYQHQNLPVLIEGEEN